MRTPLVCLLLTAACHRACPPAAAQSPPPIATFSIVAFDPETGELGVAVQSKFIAVGAVVPHAQAGVGAVATQAWANPTYGPQGLALLAAGKSPQEALDGLFAADPSRAKRQAAMVDATGRAATTTGAECMDWAGGKLGKHCAAQGNILAGPEVVDGLVRAFEATEGELALRLLAALDAGQAAGGDRRGMQSAALLIVRAGWGYGGQSDRYRDLRVDDHATPIAELRRVYDLHQRLFPSRRAEGLR